MEKEILQLLQNMNNSINDLKNDVSGMKSDISDLKSDVSGLKSDVQELKTDVSGMKLDISDLKQGQGRIEVKLDAVFNQTAEITEFRTETNEKLDDIKNNLNAVEVVTAKNWNDILGLKAKH